MYSVTIKESFTSFTDEHKVNPKEIRELNKHLEAAAAIL
jgi:hypothetical protein